MIPIKYIGVGIVALVMAGVTYDYISLRSRNSDLKDQITTLNTKIKEQESLIDLEIERNKVCIASIEKQNSAISALEVATLEQNRKVAIAIGIFNRDTNRQREEFKSKYSDKDKVPEKCADALKWMRDKSREQKSW